MKILPVIDLLGGVVVRGVAGRRNTYAPIISKIAADSRPQCVATALATQGYCRCYVADLDAIMHRRLSSEGIRSIHRAGLRIWLDAGLDGTPSWSGDFEACLDTIVLGIETLSSLDRLRQQLSYWRQRAVLSLDMNHGRLVGPWADTAPIELVRDAYNEGCRRFLVLDLAAVGMQQGVSTLSLCRQIRTSWPGVELTSGGGVRHARDLARLEHSGCDFALVASALHDGQITRETRWSADVVPDSFESLE